MSQVTLLDLLLSDVFREVQKFLSIEDLFCVRCLSSSFRDYVDTEFRSLKAIRLPNQNKDVRIALQILIDICGHLEELNLSENDWLSDDLIMPLLKINSKTLKSVKLNRCNSLSPVAIPPLLVDCKNLKKLELRNCDWLTVGCLETIAFHHTNLEELDLSDCKTISERCLVILLPKFQNIKVLCLAMVSRVNDNVLFSISRNLSEIVHLNLFKCNLITDRGIGALSLNCKKLETISIRGCENVTERSLAYLRSRNIHIDVPRNTPNAFINQFQNRLYLQV